MYAFELIESGIGVEAVEALKTTWNKMTFTAIDPAYFFPQKYTKNGDTCFTTRSKPHNKTWHNSTPPSSILGLYSHPKQIV